MSDSRFSKIENIDILDPLGEIRRRAKDRWRAAGEPGEKTWEDFFQLAEDDLLGGRSGGDSSARKREQPARRIPSLESMEIDAEIVPLVAQQESVLLSIIASASKSLLTEHDSLCVARVLGSHLIHLRSGDVFDRLKDDLIAPVLAQLASEYNSEFLNKHGFSDGRSVNLPSRVAYWNDRLFAFRKADAPLSYADRNTIARLRVAIASEPRVLEVTFKD